MPSFSFYEGTRPYGATFKYGTIFSWHDAADTSTITESGGSVSLWADKSGNGNDLAQGTAARQPTSGAASWNSRNVLSFDGGDTIGIDNADINTQGTIFVAFRPTTAAPGYNQWVISTDNNNTNGRVRLQYQTNPRFRSQYRNNGGNDNDVLLNAGSTSQHIWTFKADASNYTTRWDGNTVVSAASPSQLQIDTLHLGSTDLTDNTSFQGEIGEVIVYQTALEDWQVQETELYLSLKWNIPLTVT